MYLLALNVGDKLDTHTLNYHLHLHSPTHIHTCIHPESYAHYYIYSYNYAATLILINTDVHKAACMYA